MPPTPFREHRARALLVLTLGCGIVSPVSLVAQVESPPAPANVEWWHGALFLGGVSTLMLLDNAVEHGSQHLRSSGTNGLASTVRHFGQPEVYATTALGLLTAGLVTGNPKITGMGKHLTASLALTTGVIFGGKTLLGRARPDDPRFDGDDFGVVSGDASLPSGHTAMAFALATSLADDIDRPLATVGLYTAATAVGWSRINDDRHWLSDVAAGAVLGIASAKFASGRWTIFGLRAPTFITGPGGVGLGWQASF
ncbi:MAG TPA: phosphatase PAP2 family protein [Gemmatimonadales bacterium]|nr:phosphatase PAP2 family protein [Gemmatimonadales bacterium]